MAGVAVLYRKLVYTISDTLNVIKIQFRGFVQLRLRLPDRPLPACRARRLRSVIWD